MENYMIDTPVQINIWIRHELFKKQFEVIKKVKPKYLIVQSDGGRNLEEWNEINKSRDLIETQIDWDCELTKLFMPENKGLYSMLMMTRRIVWEKYDRCIFLEDDEIPSVSLFRFCQELLERYENDERIGGIMCFNPLGIREGADSDYFFCECCNSWGYATWRRSDSLLFDTSLNYYCSDYTKTLLKKRLDKVTYKKAMKCGAEKKIDGHIPAFEFFYGIGRATQNVLYIVPTYNLISNYGCGSDSTHSSSYKVLPKSEQRLYYSKAYDYSFPLKHPQYVISDVLFQKKTRKIYGQHNPFRKFMKKICKAFKTLIYEGPSGLTKKIKKARSNKHES